MASLYRLPLTRFSGLTPIFGLLLLSLPLPLLCSHFAFLPRGFVNLELLLIAAVAAYLPWALFFVLLLLDVTFDFICTISLTYQLSYSDLYGSLDSLPSLSFSRIWQIVALYLLLLAACLWIALHWPRKIHRARCARLCLGTAAMLSTISVLYFGQLIQHDTKAVSRNLSRSSIYSILRYQLINMRVNATAQQNNEQPMHSATEMAMQWLQNSPPENRPNLVLVIVESWGLPLDRNLQSTLLAPYRDPRITNNYDLQEGTVGFHGSTVSGEARELCHSQMGLHILQAQPEQLRACLPVWLHNSGYESYAIHGYEANMFERRHWYQTIGFDQKWFRNDFDLMQMPECGQSFQGTCDDAIAPWIAASLLETRSSRPRFIYWLTLNTHLPLPTHLKDGEDGNCMTFTSLGGGEPLCTWFQLESRVLQSIQQMALGKTARPTVFVIVGDHAPPFSTPSLRDLFSQKDVPYLILRPRSHAAPSAHPPAWSTNPTLFDLASR